MIEHINIKSELDDILAHLKLVIIPEYQDDLELVKAEIESIIPE